MNRAELIAIRLNLIERNYHPNARPTLVAVTKKCPFTDIEHAYNAGIRDFGENRIEELEEKASLAEECGLNDINWHFIGQIQSKKINRLLRIKGLTTLHSVDTTELLQKIMDKEQHLIGERLNIMLQVNTSNEREKSGFTDWDELAKATNLLLKKKESKLYFHGLMTMSKLRTNKFHEDALKCFEQLSKIKQSLMKDFDIPELRLSMGMSGDYELALQVGTDYIRLGSSLFAPDSNKT